MIIGIDIGSTTTKIVGLTPEKKFSCLTVKALDPVTSATGALGRFLLENGVSISTIKCVTLTGVGALKIKGNIFDIPTKKIAEFEAIGRGGLFLSARKDALIANIGTGTAIVHAQGESISHIGGTGLGGGTIMGLGQKIVGSNDSEKINELAFAGELGKIDLLIGDISEHDIGSLTKNMVAANFAKLPDNASEADYARSLLTMIFQSIGTITAFAARSINHKTVVITGSTSRTDFGYSIINNIGELYGIEYLFPENAEYTTALGSALSEYRN